MGQVEVEVAGEADTTVVVVNPGWGDAVQANKAGLMEIADVFVVNKADRAGLADTVADLERMLSLRTSTEGWRPPVVATDGDDRRGRRRALGGHEGARGVGGGERRARAASPRPAPRPSCAGSSTARLLQRATELAEGHAYDDALAAVLDRRLDPWSAAATLLD